MIQIELEIMFVLDLGLSGVTICMTAQRGALRRGSIKAHEHQKRRWRGRLSLCVFAIGGFPRRRRPRYKGSA